MRARPASKLAPAPLPAGRVHRHALHDRLDDSFGARLTTVVGGAGFGKSTLVAAWAADVVCAWLTLDRADASLARFAGLLDAALRQRVPALPEAFRTAAEQPAPRDDDPARIEALAGLLCEGLDGALRNDLVLVLDDVHELPARSASARLIGALCRQAPAALHLVLSSRAEPPFPIDRLRGRGQVLEIDAPMLAFSLDEVAQLLASLLGSDEPAQALHELTAGWPAAVRLAVEFLRDVPTDRRRDALQRLRRPEGPLFAYLAEEAFSRESRAARELLRTVAPLERFDAQLCAQLELSNAPALLSRLARRGLFVQREPAADGDFTVHTLVREFVAARWPLGQDELRAIHLQAASWLEARGHLDAALRSRIASGEPEQVRRLLSERGFELLAAGAIDDVLAAVEMLPPEARDERLEQVSGEARALRGDWEGALACYKRAARGRSELPPALAWRTGRLHFDRGEPELALEAYRRGRVDGSDPAEEARLLGWTASAHLSRGELAASKRLAADALAHAVESGDARALAVAHNVSMVLALRLAPEQADAHYRAGLDAAERAGDALQTIRIRSNHAAKLIQEGAYEQALAELEPAVSVGEAAGVPLALAFALLKRGETRVQLGQLDVAIADFEAARSLYERFGSSRVFGALMEMGEVYRERGDRTLARAALEQALVGAEHAEDVQVLAYALGNLARVVAVDEPGRALALAERGVESARESGHALVFCLLSAGWVALACGDREEAAARASEAALAAGERGDRAGGAESLELAAMAAAEPARETDRLAEAAGVWRELGSSVGELRARLALARLSRDRRGAALALRQLRHLGVRLAGASAGTLAALPDEEPAPVAIEALGGFRVLRAGTPVPLASWQSRKARDLLKLLVAARGRAIPRPDLMATLWPGEDPAKTSNRLSVALATVRAVLDPERRWATDRLVHADRAAISLDLSQLAIDVEDFLADAELGLRLLVAGRPDEAIEPLETAEAAYTGEFLEDDLYEDWALPLREEARATYVSVAGALADLARETGDDAVVRYRLRAVERAADDERVHLALVSTLVAARRHGEARRAYGAYVSRMEAIGVEPAPFPALEPEQAPP